MAPLTKHPAVLAWVEEIKTLCNPDAVYWCDGSDAEKERLTKECLASGELEALNPTLLSNCYLHRSHPNDVARTENVTFICTPTEDEAGPTNHWMAPAQAYQKLGEIFRGSMKGRTLYVIPFIMGPAASPFKKIGVQITDSRYVVLSMRVMTRMGKIAWDALGERGAFTKCLHGKAEIDPQKRFICHFPQDNTVWSVGSAYGGNALLGKKCMALRIASYLARAEGWFAEHMLITGIQNPQGEVKYIAAAFPSACGKTNLAMLIPPKTLPGYKVWTLGDDIAWLHIGADGRLWAINPEAGFFGVAPGTSERTNPNALRMVQRNTIFTNVLKTDDGGVWWEGMGEPPAHGINWAGHDWTPASTEKAAHPNSRFTTPLAQCPALSPESENPQGVPISAIFFGARRARVAPLICEARSWQHGVYLGATLASETTAAATGQVGVVRRDPMAMLPFIGYNAGDYFNHWLEMGKRLGNKAPKIFHVNWFRKPRDGAECFLWPGFGENLRPVLWALDRCEEKAAAAETPMGFVPTPDALPMQGLELSAETLTQALEVRAQDWTQDLADQETFFSRLGRYLPPELRAEKEAFIQRLNKSA
jgi:phosphoenolpyruvate carboxykinase (GTP)